MKIPLRWRAAFCIVFIGSLSRMAVADNKPMISDESFGKTLSGESVWIYTLRNAAGCEARITNYGGIVVSLKTPDRQGHLDDVVMGFDTLDGYLTPTYAKSCPYFGALIGRYANRIDQARFDLDGKAYRLPANNGPNTLHGGTRGFDKRVWRARTLQTEPAPSLELTYESADGEEGFPGKLTVRAVYSLVGNEDCDLRITFTATTDAPTVVNLTNHSYFNLKGAGNGDILDHEITLEADKYTPIDAESIPLPGGPADVAGTPFDFTHPTKIGAHIGADDVQLKNGKGYDHNFVRRDYKPLDTEHKVATVYEAATGRTLEVWTDKPGVQFYTGNFLDGTITGKGGKVYPHRGAFCLEPQSWPDSPNRPDFPPVVLHPGETYHHTIIYRFSTRK